MSTPREMTSLERVMTALQHREPDRVPLFLTVTMHGARELGMALPDYLRDPAAAAEGQVRMRARYHHDCLIGFFYGAIEAEAFGGETVFRDDGPPNAGPPVITRPEDIDAIEPPPIEDNPPLERVLRLISLLAERARGEVPVLGVAIGPFSLPILQMGFDRYLDLLHDDPVRADRLLRVNEAFCVAWANAQFRAGATAVTYYDPMSSPTITDPDTSRRIGFPLAGRVLKRWRGPGAIHFASGRCRAVIEDVAATGAVGVGASLLEDLAEVKSACRGRLAVIGNLNGIEMATWDARRAEREVREAIVQAAPGGGFILSDAHGEIPWQVPEETLHAISDAVMRFGRYPIQGRPDG